MQVKERLAELLKVLDLKQYQFAAGIGVQPASVSEWLNKSNSNPTLESLIRISKAYNVNAHWLVTGEGEMFNRSVIPAKAGIQSSPFISLPVVADIAAGIGIEAEDIEPSEYLSVDKSVLSLPGPYYCFKVSGTSMQPEIRTGDYAIISASYYDIDYNGRICAFRSEDGLLIKRLYTNHKGKNSLLIPINPTHDIMVYDENSPDITIIGVLIAIIRKY